MCWAGSLKLITRWNTTMLAVPQRVISRAPTQLPDQWQ